MNYRKFGKSNIDVSVLGFGCMRLPQIGEDKEARVNDELAIPLLRRAYELGINYFDTAHFYCNYDSQRAVGVAVKPFRDKIYLSTKIPPWSIKSADEFWKYLMTSLERIDTNYIDFYHIHGISRQIYEDVVKKYDFVSKMYKAKELGLIRHLSFSFHDNPDYIKNLVDMEVFDSLLCQYNLLDRSNEESIAYAASKGVGVCVMGPLAGGNLVKVPENFTAKFGLPDLTPTELGLNFVLSNQNVSLAISGMSTMEELEENVKIVENMKTISNVTFSQLASRCTELNNAEGIYCSGCGYCVDKCPQRIKPQLLFNAYNLHKVWGLTKNAKEGFELIGSNESYGEKLENCTKCGACSRICPQKIQIPEEFDRIIPLLKQELYK